MIVFLSFIVPYSTSRELFNRELSSDERSVRGNLVKGLTEEDIFLLDGFEGDVRKHSYIYANSDFGVDRNTIA